MPEKKRTKGDHTKLKLLHNLYCRGELKVDTDGLVVVRAKAGELETWAISVPYQIYPGLAMAMHLRFNHPSKLQLTQLLARHFYAPGLAQMVTDLVDNCGPSGTPQGPHG